MTSLVFAAIFFAVIHLGISGTGLRGRLIGVLGQAVYMAGYSALSVAGVVWLAMSYDRAPYVATWGMLEWWKSAAILVMLPAFLLAVIGLTTPNPTSVAQEQRLALEPTGILRVTRHPFLVAVGIWAIVHLIGNGDVASSLFFGSFAVVALAGTVSIDAKRRRSQGDLWAGFAARTSILPFAAIVTGRNRFRPGETRPWQWIVAIVGYALMLGGHAHLFGVSPFPALAG